jgi:hypothetical protein
MDGWLSNGRPINNEPFPRSAEVLKIIHIIVTTQGISPGFLSERASMKKTQVAGNKARADRLILYPQTMLSVDI